VSVGFSLEKFMSENDRGKDAVDLGGNAGLKRKCLEFGQDLPGPTPLSCIKLAKMAHSEPTREEPVESTDSLVVYKFLKQVYEGQLILLFVNFLMKEINEASLRIGQNVCF